MSPSRPSTAPSAFGEISSTPKASWQQDSMSHPALRPLASPPSFFERSHNLPQIHVNNKKLPSSSRRRAATVLGLASIAEAAPFNLPHPNASARLLYRPHTADPAPPVPPATFLSYSPAQSSPLAPMSDYPFPSADIPLFSGRNKPLPSTPQVGSISRSSPPTRPLPPTPLVTQDSAGYREAGHWYRKVSLWPPLDLGDPFAASSSLGTSPSSAPSILPSVSGSVSRPHAEQDSNTAPDTLYVTRPQPARRPTSPMGKHIDFFRRPRQLFGLAPAEVQGSYKPPHRLPRRPKTSGDAQSSSSSFTDQKPNIRVIYPCFQDTPASHGRSITPSLTSSGGPSSSSSTPQTPFSSPKTQRTWSSNRTSIVADSFSDYSERSQTSASTAPTSIHLHTNSSPKSTIPLHVTQSLSSLQGRAASPRVRSPSLIPKSTLVFPSIKDGQSSASISAKDDKPTKTDVSSKKKDSFDPNQPLTTKDIFKASFLNVLDEDGKPFRFGRIFEDHLTIVCFIRHFWCPLCQDYMQSIMSQDMEIALDRAGVKLVIIGHGSPSMAKAYKNNVFRCPFPIYVDPTRELYRALGMTRRTNDGGSNSDKGEYITHTAIGGIGMVVKNALKMPIGNAGDIKQLGGEFLFGPGCRSDFAHRMPNTRSHTSISELLRLAHVDPNATDAESVFGLEDRQMRERKRQWDEMARWNESKRWGEGFDFEFPSTALCDDGCTAPYGLRLESAQS